MATTKTTPANKTAMKASEQDPVDLFCEPIDVGSSAVVAGWCIRFGVAEDELLAAVARVGAMPAAVQCLLKSKERTRKQVTTAASRARREVHALRAGPA